jgi:amidohydrolase
MLERALAIADPIVAWRRHVHQYPELSFREVETARFIADTLAEMGVPAQTGVARTGVVAEIGSGAPVFALRADMDALPVQEATGQPFASLHPGLMHACGHDAHVACLLGAARLLSESPPPAGTVRLLFQPSEETPDKDGVFASALMIEQGVLQDVAAIVGLHVWYNVPAGQIALSAGPQMAAAGIFEARIRGQGGHGALPQDTVDPIVLAAQAILALQTIVSRRLKPTDAGVVTVGTVHGGTRDNIIPPHVDLTGTLRSLDDGVYAQLRDEVRRALGVVRALGGEFEARFSDPLPVVVNDPGLTAFVARVGADLLGGEAVLPAEPMMTGEDFGIFAQHVPGCFFRLGGRFPGQPLRNHHDPHFDIDERALPIGTAILAETALRYLAQHASQGNTAAQGNADTI